MNQHWSTHIYKAKTFPMDIKFSENEEGEKGIIEAEAEKIGKLFPLSCHHIFMLGSHSIL